MIAFIKKGKNEMYKIPYVDLSVKGQLREEILNNISELFNCGDYILGKAVNEFENSFKKITGNKYSVAVNSGLDALILALESLGIGKGDEVITVSNSFVATVAAIEKVGAKPILVDVMSNRNINPELIEHAVSSKTKAIIPVHLAGHACDMDEIMTIARKHKLFIIEDAAQAVGTLWNKESVGFIGHIGCFSLHPLKNLGACGDAGIVVTNNEQIYERLLLLRSHGLKDRDHCEFWGNNSRLDTIQAIILNSKLKYLEQWNKRRRDIADYYDTEFRGLPIELPIENEREYAVYHAYVIKSRDRDKLQQYLLNEGIEAKVHYPIPIHKQKAFVKRHGDISLKETERQSREILSLPINHTLSDYQIEFLVKKVLEYHK